MIDALRRNPGSLPERGDDVDHLVAEAEQAGLGFYNEPALDVLLTLRNLARQPYSAAAVTSLLDRFDPAKVRFTNAAATTFTPRLSDVRTRDYGDDVAGPQGLIKPREISDGSGGTRVKPSALAMKRLQDDEAAMLASRSLVEARIMLTIAALARAYTRYHRRDDERAPGTFLVFLGPEFWFRGVAGPCEIAEADRVRNVFRAVSLLYPDVLIMPGTIVSGEHYPGFEGPSSWFRVRNTAPAFWNGNLIHEVDKQEDAGTTSGIEPLAGEPSVEKAQTKGKGSSFFSLGDLRIAIDICADHNIRRAAREAEREQAELADIHLVSGFGQTITQVDAAFHPRHSTFGLSADSSGGGGSHLRPGTRGFTRGEIVNAGGEWEMAPDGTLAALDAPQAYWPPVPVGDRGSDAPRRPRRGRGPCAVVDSGSGEPVVLPLGGGGEPGRWQAPSRNAGKGKERETGSPRGGSSDEGQRNFGSRSGDRGTAGGSHRRMSAVGESSARRVRARARRASARRGSATESAGTGNATTRDAVPRATPPVSAAETADG